MPLSSCLNTTGCLIAPRSRESAEEHDGVPTEDLALLAGGDSVDVRLPGRRHGVARAERDLLIVADDVMLVAPHPW